MRTRKPLGQLLMLAAMVLGPAAHAAGPCRTGATPARAVRLIVPELSPTSPARR